MDLEEGTITVKARNSKTGGIRHIDICPALKSWLKGLRKNPESSICPKNWGKKWKALRRDANLESPWVQDVLRHTFASYYMKRYKNLPRLQSQMGHADLSLLRTRYVNMYGIKKARRKYFSTRRIFCVATRRAPEFSRLLRCGRLRRFGACFCRPSAGCRTFSLRVFALPLLSRSPECRRCPRIRLRSLPR